MSGESLDTEFGRPRKDGQPRQFRFAYLLLWRDGEGALHHSEHRELRTLRRAVKTMPEGGEVVRIWRGRPLVLEYRTHLVL